MKLLPLLLLVLTGCASHKTASHMQTAFPEAKVAPATPDPMTATNAVRAEQIRTDCIQGRRLVCGKVLKILPDGLVVDSGYTDLLREPLSQSWVNPGSVSVSRNANVLELNEPGTPCIGLVFLTGIPKRQKVNTFDYVVMMGYPAGQYVYSPAPNIEKPIRKFACGLDTAVKLNLRAEENAAAK